MLENMHCSEAFSLLMQDKYNLFSGMSVATRREVREVILKCVLATDMSEHFKLIGQLQKTLESKRLANTTFTANQTDDRYLLLEAALHSADIGQCLTKALI